MKFYSIDPNVDVVETPVEEQGRLIRHLHLAKGKQIPEHSADALVTVVCLEGFYCLRRNCTIGAGKFSDNGAE